MKEHVEMDLYDTTNLSQIASCQPYAHHNPLYATYSFAIVEIEAYQLLYPPCYIAVKQQYAYRQFFMVGPTGSTGLWTNTNLDITCTSCSFLCTPSFNYALIVTVQLLGSRWVQEGLRAWPKLLASLHTFLDATRLPGPCSLCGKHSEKYYYPKNWSSQKQALHLEHKPDSLVCLESANICRARQCDLNVPLLHSLSLGEGPVAAVSAGRSAVALTADTDISRLLKRKINSFKETGR